MVRPKVLVIGDVFADIVAGPLKAIPQWGEVSLSRFAYKKDTLVDRPIEICMGGSALNTALMLHDLGTCEVHLVSAVGDDLMGSILEQQIGERGLSCHLVRKTMGTATCLVLSGEDRAFVSYHGALEVFNGKDVEQFISWADHIHVSGYFNCPALQDDLVDLLKAKSAGVTVSLSPQHAALGNWHKLDCISEFVDILFMNSKEICAFKPDLVSKGTCLPKFNASAEDCLKSIKGSLVVTDGSAGAYFHSKGRPFLFEKAVSTRCIDATGAGDAFCAGFLSQWVLDGSKCDIAMRKGSVCGSFAVSQVGASVKMVDTSLFNIY